MKRLLGLLFILALLLPCASYAQSLGGSVAYVRKTATGSVTFTGSQAEATIVLGKAMSVTNSNVYITSPSYASYSYNWMNPRELKIKRYNFSLTETITVYIVELSKTAMQLATPTWIGTYAHQALKFGFNKQDASYTLRFFNELPQAVGDLSANNYYVSTNSSAPYTPTASCRTTATSPCYTFDGSHGLSFNIVSAGAPCSITFWMYFPTVSVAADQYLLGRYCDADGYCNGFAVRLESTDPGKIYAATYPQMSGTPVREERATITTGWHHIAITLISPANTSDIGIYVDGVDGSSVVGTPGGTAYTGLLSSYIGYSANYTSPYGYLGSGFIIDDFNYYNYTLSATEVGYVYNAEL